MKHIELKRLELTNYRNIDFATYEFDGNSKIIGENRIGKTNTLESICWLLSDKLLDGSSDVAAIKPLKDTKLEVRVKATFQIDEKTVEIEKTYKENWVKTRGTTDLEMKGHTTTYFYNGVKQSTVKAYTQLMVNDFGFMQDALTKVDFMQMLTNPFYLGNLGESKDWTELRAFIIRLVGDVSDTDVINANPTLRLIESDLNLVSGRIDQLKKKYSSDADALKTAITGDESQVKMLEETQCPTADEIEIAKKGIEEHQDKINELKNSNGTDTASKELEHKMMELRIEIKELENKDLENRTSNKERINLEYELDELRNKQSDLIKQKTEVAGETVKVSRAKYKAESEVESKKTIRAELIAKLREIDAEIAKPKVEHECPHCHRPYEQDDVETVIAKRTAELKERKEELIMTGKNNKIALENYDAEAKRNAEKLEELESKEREIQTAIEQVNTEIENKKKQISGIQDNFTPNPEIAVLKDKLQDLGIALIESKRNFSNGLQNTNQLIYDEEEAMKPFKEVIANKDYYDRQMAQLVKVKEVRQLHTLQLADVEQKRELLNDFIYTKLKMLDDNVSKVFGNIRFQLIKENINGGFDAICKPYIYDTVRNESTDTSWKSGSKSERVITGIAITECIKKVLGLPNMPYLFDEGGEISTETFKTRFATESQIICVKIADNIPSPLVQKLC